MVHPARDEIDDAILRELQADGRLSNADLARRIGLSQAATHGRVRRLERDGIIDRYVALVDREQAGFDLDEVTEDELDEPQRSPAAYGLAELGTLLGHPELLPPGVASKVLGSRDWSWLAPGMAGPVRVTTDPDYLEQHPDSTELWSPGSPLFPVPDLIAAPQELEGLDLGCLMRTAGSEHAKPGTKA